MRAEIVAPVTQKRLNPWTWAELKKTYPANHRRCKMIRAKCNIIYGPGKLKQVRKYKNIKTKETLWTVEIEF